MQRGHVRGRTALTLLLLAGCRRRDQANRPDASDAAPRVEDFASHAPPVRSAGCGARSEAVDAIRSTDRGRSYVLVVPRGAPDEPRALVLAFHGSYADGKTMRATLDFERHAGGHAIFVYPDGVATAGASAWNLTAGGPDVAMVDSILRDVEAKFCVDTRSIFAVGFSYGGWMVNALACARPGVLRGIASIEGGGPNVPCSARVAAMIIHGSGDFDEPITSGEASRDHWLEADACGKTATASSMERCVSYRGCAAPVLFCRHDGAHVVPDFAPAAVWSFFERLR